MYLAWSVCVAVDLNIESEPFADYKICGALAPWVHITYTHNEQEHVAAPQCAAHFGIWQFWLSSINIESISCADYRPAHRAHLSDSSSPMFASPTTITTKTTQKLSRTDERDVQAFAGRLLRPLVRWVYMCTLRSRAPQIYSSMTVSMFHLADKL